MLESLTAFVQPWADLYAESAWLSTAVLAVHVLALFIGGGLALSADRAMLRARTAPHAELCAVLRETASLHPVIIGALSVTITSGLGLFASDVGTFVASPVFWTKMALFLILLGNGGLLVQAERRLLDPAAGARHDSARARLSLAAGVSLASWTCIVLLGVIVGNV